jgi:hypothetical protein
MSTFDSTKQLLPAILRDVNTGRIQLPDFQRGWVWDDGHVRSLLVSIARSFPVGAVMLLETGGDVRFQVRPVENVSISGKLPEPELLILDGQQRLTSLTQVLMLNEPVKTFNEKGKPIRRFYYLDIRKALEDSSLEDAFIAIEDDRQQKSDFGRKVDLDLSTTELECRQLYFPCNQILNSDRWEESLQEHGPEHFAVYMQFRRKVLNAFREYQLPVIVLKKETSKEAVCLVFEKVNTGGVPLSVFELVTATYAADGFNLRDDWFGSELRKKEGRVQRLRREPVLTILESTDFLQAITLLHTYERRQQDIAQGRIGKSASAVSAKRGAVLALELTAYQKWADPVEQAFGAAAKFLRQEFVYTARDLPYRTQLAPLAAVLVLLGNRWREPRIYDKLARWYWCGVLGELYGGAVETRIANDLEDLLAWVDGDGAEPRTVYEAAFSPGRLDTLRSRLAAAYKGLSILVLREGAKDFFWKASIKDLDMEEVALDIHHLFPRIWCENQGIKPAVYNSIVNKAQISYKANRMIGGRAPSEYLRALQNHPTVQLDDSAMNDILDSHLIDAEPMRADDFEEFFRRRKQALLGLVEIAMGKAIPQSSIIEETAEDEDLTLEEREFAG